MNKTLKNSRSLIVLINFLYRMTSHLRKLTLSLLFLRLIYLTFYVPFCSHHPPPLPAETLSSCLTDLPFKTVVPGTAPPSSSRSSSTTVSPGEGKLDLYLDVQNSKPYTIRLFTPVGVNICMHAF